ncbi:sodium- and chloride-dependent glycine transporter 1-like [Haemaphysalis longicornis]
MEVPRQKWASNVEFLLASTGMSIGLGNIWRFPYVAYSNGGGAFLLPYLIIMTVVGRAMFYMEMLMGQFRSAGATQVFDCVPMARGVGWAMVYTCFVIALYYNLLLSYSLNFLWYSFKSVLPWTFCDPEWADENCVDSSTSLRACKSVNKTLYSLYSGRNGTDVNTSVVLEGKNGSVLVPWDAYNGSFSNCSDFVVSSPEEFYENYVLGVSSGVHELGKVQTGLAVGLAVSWVAVFFCVFKGVRSSGKVSYFTAVTPFFILGVILLRGITLEGAFDGLSYYFYPQWEKLKLFKTWRAAAVQIFFSISLAQGLNMMLASYNDFNNNIVRDVYIIAATDSFISIFGGIVIFSVLGNMAFQLQVPVPEVVRSAFGLAFVVYPQALSLITWPNLWSVTFFAMLFLLAIDSEFGFVEAALTPLKDESEACRAHETYVATICCVCFFIAGLPVASQGGLYILTLMDEFVASHLIPWIGVAEMVTLVFGYGISRMIADMEFMLGGPPGTFMYITWKYVLPVCVVVLAVTSLTTFESLTLNRHGELYPFPAWAQTIGFLVAGVGLAIIPIVAIKELWTNNWDFRKAVSPRDSWGPKRLEERRRYRLFMVEKGYMTAEDAERLNEEERPMRELEIKLMALEEAKEAGAEGDKAEKDPGAGGEKVESKGDFPAQPKEKVV